MSGGRLSSARARRWLVVASACAGLPTVTLALASVPAGPELTACAEVVTGAEAEALARALRRATSRRGAGEPVLAPSAHTPPAKSVAAPPAARGGGRPVEPARAQRGDERQARRRERHRVRRRHRAGRRGAPASEKGTAAGVRAIGGALVEDARRLGKRRVAPGTGSGAKKTPARPVEQGKRLRTSPERAGGGVGGGRSGRAPGAKPGSGLGHGHGAGRGGRRR